MKLEELVELKESNEDGAILTKAELRRINWHLKMIQKRQEHLPVQQTPYENRGI